MAHCSVLYVSELCFAGRTILKCVDLYQSAEINKFPFLLWNLCAAAFFSASVFLDERHLAWSISCKPLGGKKPLSPSVFSVNEVSPTAGLCCVPNCSYYSSFNNSIVYVVSVESVWEMLKLGKLTFCREHCIFLSTCFWIFCWLLVKDSV